MKFIDKILKKRREESIPEISFYPYSFKKLIIHNPKKLKEGIIIHLDNKNKLIATPFWLDNIEKYKTPKQKERKG